MPSRIASICPYCRRIVPARQTCGCIPKRTIPNAERTARHGYRAAYSDPAYQANRKRRYTLAHGACEACGKPVATGDWQCHHVIAASRFANPRQANALENLRVLCLACHKAQKHQA